MSLLPQGADLTSSRPACAARVRADTMEHVAVQDIAAQDMAMHDVAADAEEELSIPW